MEKFNSKKHKRFIKCSLFSYMTCYPFLDCSAFCFTRNDELIIVAQDIYFLHDFPALFLPKKKINWQNMTLVRATEEDISRIEAEGIKIEIKVPTGEEFIYETKTFVEPHGKLRKKVRLFTNHYSYKVLHSYPKTKILDFHKNWKKQKVRDGDLFDENEELFMFMLDNLKKYNIKQVYVEVDKKLVGLGWGVKHHVGGWVGLHLEVDYKFKGLSRFLHHERAKMFKNIKEFTLGTGAKEKGITNYKKELGPCRTVPYFYILTAGKK